MKAKKKLFKRFFKFMQGCGCKIFTIFFHFSSSFALNLRVCLDIIFSKLLLLTRQRVKKTPESKREVEIFLHHQKFIFSKAIIIRKHVSSFMDLFYGRESEKRYNFIRCETNVIVKMKSVFMFSQHWQNAHFFTCFNCLSQLPDEVLLRL